MELLTLELVELEGAADLELVELLMEQQTLVVAPPMEQLIWSGWDLRWSSRLWSWWTDCFSENEKKIVISLSEPSYYQKQQAFGVMEGNLGGKASASSATGSSWVAIQSLVNARTFSSGGA